MPEGLIAGRALPEDAQRAARRAVPLRHRPLARRADLRLGTVGSDGCGLIAVGDELQKR